MSISIGVNLLPPFMYTLQLCYVLTLYTQACRFRNPPPSLSINTSQVYELQMISASENHFFHIMSKSCGKKIAASEALISIMLFYNRFYVVYGIRHQKKNVMKINLFSSTFLILFNYKLCSL